jgi:hypothetical protein
MKYLLSLLILAVVSISGCKKNESFTTTTRFDEAKVYQPNIDPADFSASTVITNQYFPLPTGKKYIYEGTTEEGDERVEEMRLNETVTILGVECVVDNFKAFIDDELVEEAWDWYAQANDGTVWYFGEAVDNYEDGVLDNHDGAWKAGVDGALPGIIMPAQPDNGKKYREEFYEGIAEDEAQVIHTGKDVTIDFGTFENCITTRNWTTLEPGIIEQKIYAPGVGLIRETNHHEKVQIDLVAIE